MHMFYMVFDLCDIRGCEERHFTSTLYRFEDILNDLMARSTRLTEVYKPTKDTRPHCSRYYPICLFVSTQSETLLQFDTSRAR